jgi:predicted ester cyclase
VDERERSADVVRRFYDGWNRGQIDFEGLVAEEIVNHQPDVEPQRDRTEFATAVQGVMAAVPDSRWTISDLLVDGDRVAARITWAGSFGPGPFRGVEVEERRAFAVEHIHIYRLANGRMAEHWVVRDDLAMLRQLGALRS